MARLFFALWPEPADRVRLGAAAAEVLPAILAANASSAAVPERNLHLTLAFLGEVAPVHLPSLFALGDGLMAKPFQLELGTVGLFPGARVAWLGLRTVPEPLASLAGALKAGAAGLRLLPTGTPAPFRPHVTIARKVRALPEPVPTFARASWSPSGFALLASDRAAGGYRVLARWPWRLA